MTPASRRPEAVALASVAVGVLLLIAKIVVGLLTGSLGILDIVVEMDG